MVFKTWKSGTMGKNKEKRKAILLLVYIADVSCLTNRPFYMRTLPLRNAEANRVKTKFYKNNDIFIKKMRQ